MHIVNGDVDKLLVYHTTGNTTIAGTLNVDHSVVLDDTLTVTHATTFNDTVTISNGSSFDVGSGTTTLGGNLSVSGSATLTSSLTVSGVTEFTDTVTVITPTSDMHAATKAYVDSVATGLSVKGSVVAATTEDGDLGTAFAAGQEIDGVTLSLNDRILIKDQENAAQNGIYVVTSATPTRATDFDATAEIDGAFMFIESGTVNSHAGFVCNNTGAVDIGTTSISFTQFSGAGEITAGVGIDKNGNTLSVDAIQTQITQVGDLTAGSIVSGFGDIDGVAMGSNDPITSLTVDNIVIDGSSINYKNDTSNQIKFIFNDKIQLLGKTEIHEVNIESGEIDDCEIGQTTPNLIKGTDIVATDSITDGIATLNAGALSGVTTLTMTGFSVDADGDTVTNSLDNSTGGITNTGAIAGATTINASGAITGDSLTNGN